MENNKNDTRNQGNPSNKPNSKSSQEEIREETNPDNPTMATPPPIPAKEPDPNKRTDYHQPTPDQKFAATSIDQTKTRTDFKEEPVQETTTDDTDTDVPDVNITGGEQEEDQEPDPKAETNKK